MTKEEFVQEVASRSQLAAADAAKAVDAMLETITDTLKSGGEVAFTGFGKFTTENSAATKGVNPIGTRVPKFSSGSQLKAAVRSG